MKPWQRALSMIIFAVLVVLIVALWFYTTGAALRQASRDALSQDAHTWGTVADDFSAVSDRVRDAMDSLSTSQAYIQANGQASSTTTIDPAVIEQIKQQLEAHTSSSTYGEANNQ